MELNEISGVQGQLDAVRKEIPGDEAEFWLARDLQEVLGYARWDGFTPVIARAVESCRQVGISVDDHFRQATRMVALGSGSQREVDDLMLTRFACYLIAQNGDPKKKSVAYAQSYFAEQTRKQELVEKHLRETERLESREQLKVSEKALAGVMIDRGLDGRGIAMVKSLGDRALFGGRTTQQMKDLYGITATRPLADFLPSLTISAKNLVNEMSKINIERENHRGDVAISREHVDNSSSVREMLGKRGIKPEELPAEEDIAKVERRLKKVAKELPKKVLPALEE